MEFKAGDLVSIDWKYQDKTKGILGFDVPPTNNLTIKEILLTFDRRTFVWFKDKITCPVDSRRIRKNGN